MDRAGPGQIWPSFFRANNLMAQLGPNFGRTGLAQRVGPILAPLPTILMIAFYGNFCSFCELIMPKLLSRQKTEEIAPVQACFSYGHCSCLQRTIPHTAPIFPAVTRFCCFVIVLCFFPILTLVIALISVFFF